MYDDFDYDPMTLPSLEFLSQLLDMIAEGWFLVQLSLSTENQSIWLHRINNRCLELWGLRSSPTPVPLARLLETSHLATVQDLIQAHLHLCNQIQQPLSFKIDPDQAELVFTLIPYQQVGILGTCQTWPHSLDSYSSPVSYFYKSLDQTQAALKQSKSDFRILFEQAAVGLEVTHLDGQIADSNSAFQAMVGYSGAELQTINTLDLTHPDDRQREYLLYLDLAQGLKDNFLIEKRYLAKEGHLIWVRLSVSLVRDRTHRPLFAFGIVEDISEQILALEALQDSQLMLKLVLNTIPQAVFWKDTQLNYLGCNRVGARDAGLSDPVDIIGKTDSDLPWPPQQVEIFQTHDRYVLETGRPILNMISEMIQSEGQQAWVETTKVPLLGTDGGIIGLLGTYRDITQHFKSEAALRQAEAKYRSIFENAVEGIYQASIKGYYFIANPMMAHLLGYDSAEQLLQSGLDLKSQLYVKQDRWLSLLQGLETDGYVAGFESEIYRQDGSKLWISESARAIYDQGSLVGYEGTVEDISQRKQVEEALHRRDDLLQAVAEATNELLTHVDISQGIVKALQTMGSVMGVARAFVFENHAHPHTEEPACSLRYEWVNPQTSPPTSIEGEPALLDNIPYFPVYRRWYHKLSAGFAVHGLIESFPAQEQHLLRLHQSQSILVLPIFVKGNFWGFMGVDFVGFDQDSAQELWSKGELSILAALAGSLGGAIERHQALERMLHQALHDSLTGLPNRGLFDDRLTIALKSAQRHHSHVAILFLDLDRFKTINDGLGHVVGDQLLQVVARRLEAQLQAGDTIARWGGDEFTILLNDIQSTDDITHRLDHMQATLRVPIQLQNHELYITTSIGIALFPDDGQDPTTLIKNADTALYRAKAKGRNAYHFYSHQINSDVSHQLKLGNDLHRALERGELVLHYQPSLTLQTGLITRVEALVRWHHPHLGFLTPEHFIPIAEENGLVIPIGDWALEQACQDLLNWQAAGLDPITVAVNLSARQFQPQIIEKIQTLLTYTALNPAQLDLEITESLAMGDVNLTIELLHQLRSMGIQLSMDDFGTGYCSLTYLKRFPLHCLKIDKSFVHTMTDDPVDRAIIESIVTLSQTLGLKVIVEGVETVEQYRLLDALHCDEVQGFLLSSPLPANEIQAFITQHHQKVCGLKSSGKSSQESSSPMIWRS